jgi:hypothetical protein
MENISPPPSPPHPPYPVKEYVIDPLKVQLFQERMLEEQNLADGLLAGLVAALLGAILWGIVTVVTDYQTGWMAVFMGYLVGSAMRRFGKGVDKKFGYSGAALSLISCLVGNLFTAAVLISQIESIPLGVVLVGMVAMPLAAVEIMAAIFSPFDLLFYGIALYAGYRFSFRRVTPADRETFYRERPAQI